MTNYNALLPANASKLEQSFINCVPGKALRPATPYIANILTHRPGDFKVWLISEWNLSQFSSYFQNYDSLIAAGIPWLFERGSTNSVKRAMLWLGYSDIVIEEDEHLLHINPGKASAATDLLRIQHVVNASLPVHSKFYRMYFGRDLRAGIHDRSQFDACIFDDDSGNWSGEPGKSLKLDFLIESLKQVLPYQRQTSISSYRDSSLKFVSDDLGMRFDSWLLDSVVVPLSIVSIAELSTRQINTANQASNTAANQTKCMRELTRSSAQPALHVVSRVESFKQIQIIPRYGWKDLWKKSWSISYQRIETIRSI